MSNLTSFADEEEQKLALKTLKALEDFSRDESLEDDAKVWITKKEAHLIWSIVYTLTYRLCAHDEDFPEEQQD